MVSAISEDERSAMVHALGLTRRGKKGKFGRRWAYRNYFAAGESDALLWRGLEDRGLARQISKPGSLRPFHTFEVTYAGMKEIGALPYVPMEMRAAAI